ncbi:MAG: putative two-component histidine kinase [Acidimicrobiales bacterium]|nr:putative two-component histidine kinase [Acidimicrobiales bacterium]
MARFVENVPFSLRSRFGRAVHRLRRLGLHARLTAAFAVGALALSILLSGLAYGFVREEFADNREEEAAREVIGNAEVVREFLRTEEIDRRNVLERLRTPVGGTPVLLSDEQWYPRDIDRGRKELPPALIQRVTAGEPARMRYRLEGEALLAVGVPLPAVRAAYFEIVSLDELDDDLRALALALLAAGVLTTVAGALLGAAFSRRVLRPLADVRQAATAIAGGRLDTRVAKVDDADLGALVISFNDMARALQERVERDTRFASDVSHELRSPLTTLAASIEVLAARRDELPERSQQALDLLVLDVGRFRAMVEDLLEISRFDAGAASLDLDDVSVPELVLNAVRLTGHGDVPVEIEPGARHAVASVDKRRVVRVVANLLDNARKYGDGAERVSLERIGGEVRIAVEDRGPGVAEADRERVFERFSRGAAVVGRRSTGEGVGLGLALVKEHVGLHGGRVWVEDRLDGQQGARFVIALPVEAPPPVTEVEPDPGPAAVPAAEVDVVEV